MIERSRTSDPVGFATRLAVLKKSRAMQKLLQGAGVATAEVYWEFFAATSSQDSAEAFINRTRGKEFRVSGDPTKKVSVSLVSSPRIKSAKVSTHALPTCWKGWVAMFAWFAGEGAICGAATIAWVPGGLICGGIFFALGQLPDFNRPCR